MIQFGDGHWALVVGVCVGTADSNGRTQLKGDYRTLEAYCNLNFNET